MTPKELCADLAFRARMLRESFSNIPAYQDDADYLDRARLMIEELEKQLAESDASHAYGFADAALDVLPNFQLSEVESWAEEAARRHIARHTQREEKP